jgi:hypothetical protein
VQNLLEVIVSRQLVKVWDQQSRTEREMTWMQNVIAIVAVLD